MSSVATGNLSSSYLQQVLADALQSAGITANTAASPPQSDSSRLSPFAQLANTLQQLQESDPTKFKQVTQQVAANLQSAAQTARSQGNSAAASQLKQLSADFTNASQTGQLPNLQDLAQAVGGGAGASGGGHHHHHHSSNTSTDPNAIILQTLANAGIDVATS
jgi:hypothetical protein